MNSKPRKAVGKALHAQLIERFTQADRTVSEIAQELGLTLSQLANWAADPRTLSTLERLARLAEIRAQMVLSRFRANAAIQLIQIATAKDASELSRKACVDVLAADLRAFDRAPSDNDPSSDEFNHSPRTEAAILRALETLGQQDASPSL